MRGPANGDSFILLCLILQIDVMTFNINIIGQRLLVDIYIPLHHIRNTGAGQLGPATPVPDI